MTKLLFCEECIDIVAPNPSPREPRWCRCRHHAVWWEDPKHGILRVFEEGAEYRPLEEARQGWARKLSPHRAYVLGLHNDFLAFPGVHSKQSINEIILTTPESYLFRTQGTVIIRIRPGASNDTDWADQLPPAAVEHETRNPPFDGKPCPACPMEVRDLAATAHNALLAVDHARNSMGDWNRAYRKLEGLRGSLSRMQSIVNKHFADTKHSLGK